MIDSKLIEKDPNSILENLQNRGKYDLADNLWNIISLNAGIKVKDSKRDILIEDRNSIVAEFSKIKSENKGAKDHELEIEKINKKIEEADKLLEDDEKSRNTFLMKIPNILHIDVPKGIKKEDNKLISAWPKGQVLKKKGKTYLQIANTIDLIKGTEISGVEYSILMGKVAGLERAIGNFFMDFHVYHGGYKEVSIPLIASRKTLEGAGQLPEFEKNLVSIGKDKFLIPEAEASIINIYRDEILKEEDLPIKIVTHTSCFEVNSDDVLSGIAGQYQFNKVELIWVNRPETSDKNHNDLLGDVEAVIRSLSIPYRIMLRCSSETPLTASKCYDIEVWLPSQNAYRKISSISQFGDFQARRINIKFKEKEKGKKSKLANTINGSGLDINITLAALLEHYVQKDGTIKIPAVLVPYTKFNKIEF